jgi:hypothetical protein
MKIDNKFVARAVIVVFGVLAALFIAGDIWATLRHH